VIFPWKTGFVGRPLGFGRHRVRYKAGYFQFDRREGFDRGSGDSDEADGPQEP
jgi:hypothetical protein